MGTTGIITSLVIAFSLVTAGSAWCDELGESYYPLKEGMRWEYIVISDKSDTKKLIITNLAPREVQGKKVTPRRWDLGGHIFIEFMEKDDYGVYRYAEQIGEKGTPTLVTPKECHLRFPIAEGNSWNMTTKLGNNPLNVSLTIESVSEDVKVPAGSFKDCLKIKQVGSNDAGASVTGCEWYAPKVGIVESLVTIKQKSREGTPTSENRTYKLQSFKP
ncbi:MAG: hypothetical protein ACOZFS_00515 [Thermodesulfobacteriota bacterium]